MHIIMLAFQNAREPKTEIIFGDKTQFSSVQSQMKTNHPDVQFSLI